MRATFKTVFYVNASKEKNGVVPIMGRVTINGTIAQFSCKQTILKSLWDAKGNRAKGKSKEAQAVNFALDNIKGFDASARKALLTYPWPGNVRELKQKIQVAVLHTEADMITKENLEFGSDETLSSSSASFALRNDAEDKERILRALKQANGNRKIAAELLGIGRTTLYSKLEEYGLKYKFGQS